jgi:hypothetical protein
MTFFADKQPKQDLGWVDAIPGWKVEIDYMDSDIVEVKGQNGRTKTIHSMGHLRIWATAEMVDQWEELPMYELRDHGRQALKRSVWKVIQSVNWEDCEPVAVAHLRDGNPKNNKNKILCFQFPVFRIECNKE